MPFQDGMSIPEELLFRMKSLKGMTKNVIDVLPTSQQDYKAGSITSFVLPYSSLISLDDISLMFEGQTEGAPVVNINPPGGGNPVATASRALLFPQYTSSLIDQLEVLVNGQVVQSLHRYNDTFNLLKHFETGSLQEDILENANPNNKRYIDFVNGIKEIGYMNWDDHYDYLIDKNTYCINSFFGLLGGGLENSSRFLDTNILGEVIIRITWAKPNVLMYGQLIPGIPAALQQQAEAINSPNYILSKMKMSVTRYNFPSEYYSAISSNLSGGSKYKIAFNHYEHFSAPAAQQSSLRFNINSRDIKYMLGYFTNNSRNTTTKPLPREYGDNENWQQSSYFAYSGFFHEYNSWLIGSTKLPQNPQDNTTNYLNLLRLKGQKGKGTSFNGNINDLIGWQMYHWVAPLSLEYAEDPEDNVKLLSGLSSENLPISISFDYTNKGTIGIDYSTFTANTLVATTRILEIGNGQQVSVMI